MPRSRRALRSGSNFSPPSITATMGLEVRERTSESSVKTAVRGVHAEGVDIRFGKRVRDRGEGIKADDDGVDVLVVEQQLGHVRMNLVVRAGVYVEGVLDWNQLLQPFLKR